MSIVTLKNEKQFSIVNKLGKKSSSGSLILVYYQDFSKKAQLVEENFYYGMKVSKKFAKSSPERNKAKRRIRALIRSLNKSIDLPKGGAVIFIPKKNFNEYSFKQAASDIKWQLAKLK